jgi:aspartyl-tRNA(Asn)/glutamyl-tRNA(Gln) amidotransferase subunit C
MEVNDALINKLADLARLQIEESERASIKKDLQDMIAFVEKLNELDLADVEPLLHISHASNHLREDLAQLPLHRAAALKNAPLHDYKFFKVPKVIKK